MTKETEFGLVPDKTEEQEELFKRQLEAYRSLMEEYEKEKQQ